MDPLSLQEATVPHPIAAHGTYIQGDRRWKFQRWLRLEEVANELKLEVKPEPGKSLWRNNGYVVVELHPCSEDFRHADIKPGMHAISLSDGSYSLYEYRSLL